MSRTRRIRRGPDPAGGEARKTASPSPDEDAPDVLVVAMMDQREVMKEEERWLQGVRCRCVLVGVWPCRGLIAGAAARPRRGGSVLDVEITILDKQSKGVPIDEQANDDVVHLDRFREADRLTDQTFDPCA